MKTIVILGIVAIRLMASDLKQTTLVVRVMPEVLVSVNGTESVGVRIRLSPGANAQVWIGDNCSIPFAAGHSIGQSGMLEIPIAMLPGSGGMVCLNSQKDGLMQNVPLLVPRAADAVHCSNSACYVL